METRSRGPTHCSRSPIEAHAAVLSVELVMRFQSAAAALASSCVSDETSGESSMHRCQQYSVPAVHEVADRARRLAEARDGCRQPTVATSSPVDVARIISVRRSPYVRDEPGASAAPGGGSTMRPYHMRGVLDGGTQTACGVPRGTKPSMRRSFGETICSAPPPSMNTSASRSKSTRTVSPVRRWTWNSEGSVSSAGVKAMKMPWSTCMSSVGGVRASGLGGTVFVYSWICSRWSPDWTTSRNEAKSCAPSGVERSGALTSRSSERADANCSVASSTSARNGASADSKAWHLEVASSGNGCTPPRPGTVRAARERRVVPSSKACDSGKVLHSRAPASTSERSSA
mmetsp:Transcript_6133/g.19605  ORF Transcript_6133/g.19605 Transcript_6133/m.19605 type:complete len:344 (+) Transcript_6133:1813-2844(+)